VPDNPEEKEISVDVDHNGNSFVAMSDSSFVSLSETNFFGCWVGKFLIWEQFQNTSVRRTWSCRNLHSNFL